MENRVFEDQRVYSDDYFTKKGDFGTLKVYGGVDSYTSIIPLSTAFERDVAKAYANDIYDNVQGEKDADVYDEDLFQEPIGFDIAGELISWCDLGGDDASNYIVEGNTLNQLIHSGYLEGDDIDGVLSEEIESVSLGEELLVWGGNRLGLKGSDLVGKSLNELIGDGVFNSENILDKEISYKLSKELIDGIGDWSYYWNHDKELEVLANLSFGDLIAGGWNINEFMHSDTLPDYINDLSNNMESDNMFEETIKLYKEGYRFYCYEPRGFTNECEMHAIHKDDKPAIDKLYNLKDPDAQVFEITPAEYVGYDYSRSVVSFEKQSVEKTYDVLNNISKEDIAKQKKFIEENDTHPERGEVQYNAKWGFFERGLELNGHYQRWHYSGEQALDIVYKDGRPDGLAQGWLKNGEHSFIAFLRDGKCLAGGSEALKMAEAEKRGQDIADKKEINLPKKKGKGRSI